MLRIIVAGALALMLGAASRTSDWDGVYRYPDDGGRTAGGRLLTQ